MFGNSVRDTSCNHSIFINILFGSLIERIIEWMDEYYSIRLSGEVLRGMKENAARGAFQGVAPFGYKTVDNEVIGTLTDIATEEFAHMEIICAIVHQLTRNLTPEQLEKSGFDKYYVDHTLALWPQAASGTPWSATTFQSKGDPITDLHEDMAAEQKARTTYDNILRLIKDPEVCDPIRFLREREIVHYQRFGESLRIVQDKLDSKNFYAFNPEFDHKSCCK